MSPVLFVVAGRMPWPLVCSWPCSVRKIAVGPGLKPMTVGL